jgi:hypothetical protein
MFLDDVSQTMSFLFHRRLGLVPSEAWGWLSDAYGSVSLFSGALWLAACPRVITAVFCKSADQTWAQRRVAQGVLLVLVVGLAIQSAWLTALSRIHETGANVIELTFRHAVVRHELYIPWHVVVNSLLPIGAWTIVLISLPRGMRDAYHWIAAGWSLLLCVELNLAIAFSGSRMLMHVSYGNEERISVFGRATCIAVVLVALLLEYRQVWQAALKGYFDRHELAETAAPNP